MPDELLHSNRRLDWLALVLISFVLFFLVTVIGYSGNDDKYITYAAADAIATGNGFKNVNGEVAEQSSSLVYSGLLALITVSTGTSAPFIGYYVGVSLYTGAAVVLSRMLRTMGTPIWVAIVPFLSAPALYWAGSGMETGLYVLLWVSWVWLTLGLFSDDRISKTGVILAAATSALLAGTRPEAPFVIIAAVVAWGVLLSRLRSMVWVILISVAGVFALLTFRLALGLKIFPLPTYVKTSGLRMENLQNGIGYVIASIEINNGLGGLFTCQLALVAAIAVLPLAFRRTHIPKTVFGLGFASVGYANLAFSIATGGDWMPVFRFLGISYLAFIVALLLLLPRRWMQGVFALVFVIGAIFDVAKIASLRHSASPFFENFVAESIGIAAAPLDRASAIQSRDVMFTERLIEAIELDPRQSLTVASVQAGFVPYWLSRLSSKDIHFVDLRGLSTTDLHNCERLSDIWRYEPYDHLADIEACAGRKIDFFYDLRPVSRLDRLEEFGCPLVFEMEVVFANRFRTRSWTARQFLAKC